MSSHVGALRSALLLQAALTAGYGLLRSTGTGWTLLTMVVASAGVFLATALQPTPGMRTAVLGFEAGAVGFGVLGLAGGHLVPATALGLLTLVQVATAQGAAAFAGEAVPVLQVPGIPPPPPPAVVVEAPPAAPAQVQVPYPSAPADPPAVPAGPTRTAVAAMTILPR